MDEKMNVIEMSVRDVKILAMNIYVYNISVNEESAINQAIKFAQNWNKNYDAIKKAVEGK
jgi:hypothetical protein